MTFSSKVNQKLIKSLVNPIVYLNHVILQQIFQLTVLVQIVKIYYSLAAHFFGTYCRHDLRLIQIMH